MTASIQAFSLSALAARCTGLSATGLSVADANRWAGGLSKAQLAAALAPAFRPGPGAVTGGTRLIQSISVLQSELLADGVFVAAAVGGTDTTPPTVTLTAPANGATISGATVALTATASDNVGVASVEFRINGSATIGTPDTTAPYGATLDSRAFANGTHTLTAIARDAAGNTATSAPITVTISNTAASGVGAITIGSTFVIG